MWLMWRMANTKILFIGVIRFLGNSGSASQPKSHDVVV
jgi:hypothetical protein